MKTIARLRVRELALILSCVLAACGGPAPSTTAAPSGSSPASSGAIASGATALGAPGETSFDQATAVDAAQAEVDTVDHLRQEAGIAALLGAAGPTVLKNVDEAKVSNAQKTLPQVAKALGFDLSLGPSAPQIASIRGLPPARPAGDDIEWTGSLLGQVSATASMMMALLPTGIETLLGRSPDSRPGVMPNGEPETYPEKAHDGVTESVVIRTKVRITAGAGKLTMDLDISSVDTIKDEATGAEVGRLEGNAHGHIDINACPDQDGLSEGSYELSLQEELVRPGSAGAGDARVIDAPFKLIDGDDAHLQRIEGTFAITEHAHGPGGAGTGSGGPFDWSVTATVPDVIQRNGSGAPGEPSVQSNGDPTASQVAKAIGGRLTAENYLKVLARETERFWRSGKCIVLTPSDDTRTVKPKEKIDLTVRSAGKFDGQEIQKPIVATFSGAASLDPVGTPVDEPAAFTFKAGANKDDKGTIDLKQTSKRGIGTRQVVFTVGILNFQAKVDATVHQDVAGNVYDSAIHLAPLDLVPAQDGTSTASATVTWTTTYHSPGNVCKPKTYTGTFQTVVTARVDPADPTRVLLKASYIPGVLKNETLVCKGGSYPFNGGTTLAIWAYLSSEHSVPIGGSITVGGPSGTLEKSSATVTVTKKP